MKGKIFTILFSMLVLSFAPIIKAQITTSPTDITDTYVINVDVEKDHVHQVSDVRNLIDFQLPTIKYETLPAKFSTIQLISQDRPSNIGHLVKHYDPGRCDEHQH